MAFATLQFDKIHGHVNTITSKSGTLPYAENVSLEHFQRRLTKAEAHNEFTVPVDANGSVVLFSDVPLFFSLLSNAHFCSVYNFPAGVTSLEIIRHGYGGSISSRSSGGLALCLEMTW